MAVGETGLEMAGEICALRCVQRLVSVLQQAPCIATTGPERGRGRVSTTDGWNQGPPSIRSSMPGRNTLRASRPLCSSRARLLTP